MANIKISDLTALSAQPSTDDLFVIVDVSEAADADKTKKIDFGYAIKTYADTITATVFASYPEVVPSARVYNNAVIAVANNSNVTLTFNKERWDTDTIHDTSTNTGRLTCKTAGIYHIYGSVQFEANATGNRYLIIRLNGSTVIASLGHTEVAAAVEDMSISTEYSLAVNDYVELVVYQNSGGALKVNAAANYSPEFGMTFQGKAST